ncbi:helix-turn-helix transcriptional regulator [Slackia isoflavoniconvertens]
MVGRSCPFIAEKLVLSENTIRSYLQKVYSKCGVHSRQELISLVEETSE